MEDPLLIVYQVDVIVNSTNKDLDLSVGVVATQLLNAAGQDLQEECRTKYPDGIKPGQVAVTSAGDMDCEALFHGVLLPWDNGHGWAQQVTMEI